MRIIQALNPHEAFLKGMHELHQFGIPRDSRNGPVLLMPTPVTTVYEFPEQRVIFWPERDANPFFHLYESLWMLAGRERVEPLVRYAKNMANYADDGIIHGAYGARWRHAFSVDQLRVIVERLKKDPNDRRCVLQMWDTKKDLDKNYKDLPCNTMASLQINFNGGLDITVFCRSNDIIWGAYGANAVQFSTLQEYLARSIGVPVGHYYQVSVNWHAYRSVFDPMFEKIQNRTPYTWQSVHPYENYDILRATKIPNVSQGVLDMMIRNLIDIADSGFMDTLPVNASVWESVVYKVLRSHHVYKTTKDAEKAIADLSYPTEYMPYDWVQAATQWFERRLNNKNLEDIINDSRRVQHTGPPTV